MQLTPQPEAFPSPKQVTARLFHIFIQKALESYIEDFADLQIALDRLHDKGDDIISAKQMSKSLGLKHRLQEVGSPQSQKAGKTEAKRILDHIETQLIEQPKSNPVLKGQFDGLRKYRVSDHRVIYALMGNDLLILRI